MRTVKNILRHELIGLPCEIIKTSNKSQLGIKGRIVDETKNLVVIEKEDGREKKLQKISCTFRFYLEDGKTFDVKGKDIAFRPEDRPKKV